MHYNDEVVKSQKKKKLERIKLRAKKVQVLIRSIKIKKGKKRTITVRISHN